MESEARLSQRCDESLLLFCLSVDEFQELLSVHSTCSSLEASLSKEDVSVISTL